MSTDVKVSIGALYLICGWREREERRTLIKTLEGEEGVLMLPLSFSLVSLFLKDS